MKRIVKIAGLALIGTLVGGTALMAVERQRMFGPGGMGMGGPGSMHIGMGMFGFGDMGMGMGGMMADGMMNPEMLLAHFEAQLDLTKEQSDQLRPILKNVIDRHLAASRSFGCADADQAQDNNKGKGKGAARKAAPQPMWAELESKLSKILTAEQLQQFQSLRLKDMGMRSEMFGRMMQRRGEFQQLLAEVNLSSEQHRQLSAIFLKYRENRRNALEKLPSNREQMMTMWLNDDFDEAKVRQMYRDTTPQFEDFVVERAKMLYEMKAVLTPEQLAVLKEKSPQLLDIMQEHWQRGHMLADGWMFK